LAVQARFTSPNDAFVARLYQDLLGRTADPSGLAARSADLASGRLDRAGVVGLLLASPEGVRYRLDQLYERFLGREVDPAGLAAWSGQIAAGATWTDVEAGILGSDEYYTREGGNVEGFVSGLYVDLLNRAPDQLGHDSLVTYLASGGSRQAAARGVLVSGEQRTLELLGLYSRYLHRTANGGEFQTTLAAVLATGDANVALIGLLGSPEYFAAAQAGV
jgi:hypothetical protein